MKRQHGTCVALIRSLMISGPLSRASYAPLPARPQFATGPQKCVVLMPVGPSSHAMEAIGERKHPGASRLEP